MVSAAYSLPLPVTRLGYLYARRFGRWFPALPVGEPFNPLGQVNLLACVPHAVLKLCPKHTRGTTGQNGKKRTYWYMPKKTLAESFSRLTESTMTNVAKRT